MSGTKRSQRPSEIKAAAAKLKPRAKDCGGRGCGSCVRCGALKYRADHGLPLEAWEEWRLPAGEPRE
jgi:hypothetical protein